MAVLEVIKENKSILFGNFKNNLTAKEKETAWLEVLQKAQSLQLAGPDKSWTYARDNLFGLWKCRALAKRDNARKTGSSGGKDKEIDEVDAAIFEILSKDSAVLDDLNLNESYMESQPLLATYEEPATILITGSPEAIEETKIQNKKRKLAGSHHSNPSSSSEIELLKKELLKVEIYHRKLQALKLERELGLMPSHFTKDIVDADMYTEQTVLIIDDSDSMK